MIKHTSKLAWAASSLALVASAFGDMEPGAPFRNPMFHKVR